MSNIVSHGQCGIKWTQVANRTGHCSGCHETFSSLKAFDMHQTLQDGKVLCWVGKDNLVPRPDRNTGIEIWGEPGSTPVRRSAVKPLVPAVTSTTPVHGADDSAD